MNKWEMKNIKEEREKWSTFETSALASGLKKWEQE